MAFIEYFKIEGLAGHEDTIERTLDRHVNVFWGLNGTGKTSLLKILSSALQNDVDLLRGVPFVRAQVIFWSTDFQARIERNIEQATIEFSSSDDDPFNSPALEPIGDGLWREVDKTGETRVRSWGSKLLSGDLPGPRRVGNRIGPLISEDSPFTHSYLPISRLARVGARYTSRARPAVSDAALDEDFAEQVRSRWQTYNASALARIRSIQQQGLATILDVLFGGEADLRGGQDVHERVEGDAAYALVRDFLREQNIRLRLGQEDFLQRYDTQADLRNVVASIQEVTRDVEVALRPQHEFQSTIERLYSGAKTLILDPNSSVRGAIRVEVDGNRIPLQSLSSGEKQLLRLLLETLAASNASVMIDEPELSMHVDWQQVLVQSMTRVNPECQLILATHSPEIMADLPEKYIFEL